MKTKAQAKEAIKKVLLGDEGSAYVKVEGDPRLIIHSFMDQPLRKLPWPLNLLQPHSVSLVFYKGEKVVFNKIFDREHIDDAIDLFLKGVEDTKTIALRSSSFSSESILHTARGIEKQKKSLWKQLMGE